MFLSRFFTTAVLFIACAWPKTIPTVCGSSPTTHLEIADLHEKSLRRLRAAGVTKSATSVNRAATQDIGDLVIMGDSDGVVARRNPFALVGQKVTFTPVSAEATNYRFSISTGDFNDDDSMQGSPLIGLGDDDSQAVPFPFPFPFFGNRYTRLFVNSDGNLSFGIADSASTDRSLGRLVAGPPRIALMFGDLDPSRVANSVRVRTLSSSVVITWQGVPEYSDFGRGAPQTAQVRLFSDGRIEMVWQTISMAELIVGIAPGNLEGGPSLVSFSKGSTAVYGAALAERFGTSESLDLLTASQQFYLTHEDAYDFLAFYNTAGISPGAGVLAFSSPVRDPAVGNGAIAVGDLGPQYGSHHRLKAVLNMGPIEQYPTDPNTRVPLRFDAGDTPLTVLAHEAGHLFLAYTSVRDPQNPSARPMLGRDLFHWSFFFNSEASLLEGNRIQDNGPSASPRFVTTATVEGYSPLDQYLMGLRPADQVPPTFVVLNSSLPSIGGAGAAPSVGARFNGNRRDVKVEDIIAVEGPRLPDSTIAQRRFRFAIVLVTPAGATPNAATISKMENLRRQFETTFTKYTSGRASAEATLARNLRLTVEPYAGVVVGGTITAAVELDGAPAQPLTVQLSASGGLIEAPASVTVAAGSRRVQFVLRGIGSGVELLTASAGAGFLTSEARISVVASRDQLQLVVTQGDEQAATSGLELAAPIVVKLTDVLGAPYQGMAVRAQSNNKGQVTPQSTTTDAKGEAIFRWVTATAAGSELLFTLEGSTKLSARAVALGKPALATPGIVNAASYAPGLTPGGIATIFGSNLERSKVSVNSQNATVFYSSSSQLNFLTPATVAAGTASVVVSNSVSNSGTVPVAVNAVQPGIFFDSGSGLGAVIGRGSGIFEVYGTGFGDGSAGVSASIGGQPAEVLYSGPAPGFVGLQQINVQTKLGPGEFFLQLTAGEQASNSVKIQVVR